MPYSYPLPELILPSSQHAEDVSVLLERFAGVQLGGLHHGELIAAQKGIDLTLQIQRRRERGVARSENTVHAGPVFECGAVVWFHRQSETQIRRRGFVVAVHAGVRRQIA